MKLVKCSTYVALIGIVVGLGALTKAYADAVFDLSGDVPLVDELDLAWSNTHFALSAGVGGPATIYRALAAVTVYSNDPNGFTISAAGTAAGVLTGTTTAATVAYTVSLSPTQANAEAGVLFTAPGAAGSVATSYVSPIVAGAVIVNSGVLATPYNTNGTPLWVSGKYLTAATANLMADTYTDTLTISMIGL